MESGLYLVSYEENIVSVTDLPDSSQVAFVRHSHSGLSLDWLHHECTDVRVLTGFLLT